MRRGGRYRLITAASAAAVAIAFAVVILADTAASSADSTARVFATTSTKWRTERPLGLVPFRYQGAACVKGTKTCFLSAGSFAAVPAVVKTTNGGKGWSILRSSGINPKQNGIASVSCPSAKLCVGVGAQMGQAQGNEVASAVTTTNGGHSWKLAKMPAAVFHKAKNGRTPLFGVSCATSKRCVAVGEQGVIVTSTNGGSKWSSRTSGTTNTLNGVSCPSASVCYAVGNSGTVIKSVNGGKTWSFQVSNTLQSLYGISCPKTKLCYAVGGSGAVIKTTGSSTWTPQVSGTLSTLESVSCPKTNVCYAVGQSGTVIKTKNGGTLWAPQTSHITSDLQAVACYGTSGCVSGSATRNARSSMPVLGADVLYTTDGGKAWKKKEPRSPIRRLGDFGSDPISCPTAHGCFAVGTTGPIDGGSGANVILKTRDGKHWSWSLKGHPGSGALHAISCASASHCITTGYSHDHNKGVILATTDGGKKWKAQNSGVTDELWGVSCPNTKVCFTVGNSGTILRTKNGGNTWTPQASGTTDDLYGVSCASASQCVIVGSSGTILTTTNGGSTWVPRTSALTANIFGVSCHDTKHCVIDGANYQPGKKSLVGIAHTKNGGKTWSSPSIVIPKNEVWDLFSVSCTSNTHCTASGGTGFDTPGHPALLLSTTDGGQKWSKNKPPYGTHGAPGVECTSAGCWASGWGGLIISTFK